jgi:hypothetical protein
MTEDQGDLAIFVGRDHNREMSKNVLVALLAVGLGASPAAAETVTMSAGQLGDPTLLRVLREVYPDLSPTGKASQYKGVRLLPDSVDGDAGKPGSVDLDLARNGNAPDQAIVTMGAARYMLVLAENLLIAAQLAPRYRFLDAVAVQTDPGGPPFVPAAFLIAPDTPAVLVLNAHHNSQEGFVDYLLLGFVGDRLAPVYQGPALYSLSSNDAACEAKVVTQQLQAFEPLPSSHSGFADLSLIVEEQGECRNGDKVTMLPAKRAKAVLTWDASQRKYVGGAKELELLGKRPQ